MGKVVKLKQSDIEKIVGRVIQEQRNEFDDFDTKVQPEELPNNDDLNLDDDSDSNQENVGKKVSLAQDDEGNFFIFDMKGTLLAKTK